MLGISIYPDKASASELKSYIDLAHKYGYKRIFTCMLSFEGDINEVVSHYKDIIQYANQLDFEVYIDVQPKVFTKLGLKPGEMKLFNELGAAGIRLDLGYNGLKEAMMTYNEYDLNVEINMSIESHQLETILDFKPKYGKLMGCHNFYPQRGSGITFEQFERVTKKFYKNHVRTASFISSPTADHGPWPLTEGLCTMEIHRDLPLEVQAKHLNSLDYVDDIIIANMFASEEELKSISNMQKGTITFNIEPCVTNNDVENIILFENEHFNRGDYNINALRSIISRKVYANEKNPPQNTVEIFKKGDLVIGNERYGQYKNELQVILQDTENKNGMRNLVGKISQEELFLLDSVEPWQRFYFKDATDQYEIGSTKIDGVEFEL